MVSTEDYSDSENISGPPMMIAETDHLTMTEDARTTTTVIADRGQNMKMMTGNKSLSTTMTMTTTKNVVPNMMMMVTTENVVLNMTTKMRGVGKRQNMKMAM